MNLMEEKENTKTTKESKHRCFGRSLAAMARRILSVLFDPRFVLVVIYVAVVAFLWYILRNNHISPKVFGECFWYLSIVSFALFILLGLVREK